MGDFVFKDEVRTQPPPHYEIAVSFRYGREYGWVVHAITGFLSAYYMEDSRFRMKRHQPDLETGMYVWLTEAPSEKFIGRLLKRLQQDIPSFQVLRQENEGKPMRHIIDLPDPA